MSIALDTSAYLGSDTAAASLTAAYTAAGTNPLLVVSVLYNHNGASSATAPTSVTYNGQALTKIAESDTLVGTTHLWVSIWFIVGQTGTHNVVVNKTAGDDIFVSASSYSGVKQTSQPDSHATNHVTANTITTNITTVANNCWLVGAGGGQVNGPFVTPGTNMTARVTASGQYGHYDSNAAITPAGSSSMSGSDGGNAGAGMGLMLVAFAPEVSSASSSPSSSVSPSTSVSSSVSNSPSTSVSSSVSSSVSPSTSVSSSVSHSPSTSVSSSVSSSVSPSTSVSSSVSSSASTSVSSSPSTSISSSPSTSISSSPSASVSPSTSVSSSPSASPSAAPLTCLQVEINGIGRTKLVDPASLRITQVITNQPDSCDMVINKFGDRTFAPAVGDEVVVTDDGVRIFGGHITEIDEFYNEADYVSYRVLCSDYTYHMDQKLVVAVYEGMTADAILQDLKDNFLPSDVTIDNVDCATVIPYVAFKYEHVSDVLRQIAELAGADWYIDYNKDIHFFEQESETAAFDLSDTGGKYVYDSLVVRRDQTQVRTIVYVKGGDYLANTTTAVFDGNGAQRYFNLPYKMSNLHVTVTGAAKSVGVDPIDDPLSYDAMHNFQEKTVFFRSDRVPRNTSALAASQKVRIRGNPNLPILVREEDGPSIVTFTGREYFIQDESIRSKSGARQRALAELAAYKSTIAEAEFDTYESGLHTGQKITVQSTIRGLDEEYIINKIECTVFGNGDGDACPQLIFHVSLVTTRTFGFTQLLQRLLNKDKKAVVTDDTQILDRIVQVSDTGSGTDSSLFSGSPGTTYRWYPSSRNGRWGFATWK